MKKRKRLYGVLLVIVALVIMQLPVSEADAATSSASDFRMEGSTLVKYRGKEKNVSIPNTVEVISGGAFEDNKNIELVVVPNSVKEIEPYAFWGCDNLDTVVLGKGLSEVGDYTFAGCKGLKQMTIPTNVKFIGVQAFGDCVNLRDISIPKETTTIHDTAFDGCHQLTFHCEKGSAGDIFAQAFYKKQEESAEYEDVPSYGGITDTPTPSEAPSATPEYVFTPEPDTSDGNLLGSTYIVGNKAVVFVNGSNLNVYGADNSPVASQPPVADFTEGTTEAGIPKYSIVDGSIVADQAFYRKTGMEAVTLPEGIREIGQFAFARSSLEHVFIPEGVEEICYGAFYHCDSLTVVTLPDTVMNVEPKAFEYTAWVENFRNKSTELKGDFLISGGVLVAYRGTVKAVTVPEGVRIIAAEAFKGHSEIERVVMPDTLLVIGEGAFEDCTGLKDIKLNRGLVSVKDRAFYNCSASKVVVPASVEEVGLRAFEGIDANYALNGPETVYETSATRLSNEAYRILGTEQGDTGVTALGPDGMFASLEGAARNYILQMEESQERAALEKAFTRAFGSDMPSAAVVYDMEFTDSSGIPLTKLGRQALMVVLPLPDSLKGQELRLFGQDRNGQLVELPIELVSMEGQTAVRFNTNFISQMCLCPTGIVSAIEPREINVSVTSYSAGPVVENSNIFQPQMYLGFIVLLAGIVMLFLGFRKKA